MSDKSFGDHANRNVVKNPLLSTAVTGLSVEDLTHKAVLLPAAPVQGVIIQPEKTGSQLGTLAHSHYGQPIFPPIDAGTAVAPPKPATYLNPNILDSKNIVILEENASTAVSKAPLKSDDDFDVNEYFARLQGTRYISAPLHSHIKEDPNANLGATEESLEEINLNEPDKSQSEVQNSLTADIAQNFSQLPTVLPHVASAVFSSFSNMLNLKSREQTPDDAKISGYQEAQLQSECMAVPLMGVDEHVVKDVAPPPKERPIGGIGNYRITTKKKAYAQIPGLSTGDTTQNTFNLPGYQHSTSSFFTPMTISDKIDDFGIPEKAVEVNTTIYDKKENAFDIQKSHFAPTAQSMSDNFVNAEISREGNTQSLNIQSEMYNILDPTKTEPQTSFTSIENQSKESETNLFAQNFAQVFSTPQIHETNLSQTIPLIPPPPMFSNIRRDNQTAAGKLVLPPSVARRLSANHPIIKPQTTSVPAFPENIFIPQYASDMEQTVQSTSLNLPPVELLIQTSAPIVPQTSVTPFSVQEMSPLSIPTVSDTNVLRPPIFPSSIDSQTKLITPSESVPLPTSTNVTGSSSSFKESPTSPNYGSISIFTPGMDPSSSVSSPPVQPMAISSSNINIPDTLNIGPPSSMFTSITNQQISPVTHSGLDQVNIPTFIPPSSTTYIDQTLPPPTFINPLQTQKEVESTEIKQIDLTQMNPPKFFGSAPSEQVKPLGEPPKAIGNLNYRMTKKRPQYYSGPIEGIGAISNNMKPIVPTACAGAFQGALFTPEQHGQPDINIAHNVEQSSVPFDINRQVDVSSYTHFDINKPQTQEYIQQEYNTTFDFSRQTTESYEPPKEELKGFGIIGSLKSKLSSIDINKIQHTVTTFFDPAYDATKSDAFAHAQENIPTKHSTFGKYCQSQGSSFEVFVPNMEQNPQSYGQAYDYQTSQSSAYYGQGNQFHPTQNLSDYYQSEGQNIYSTTSYYSDPDCNSYSSQAHSNIPGSANTVETCESSTITSYGPSSDIINNGTNTVVSHAISDVNVTVKLEENPEVEISITNTNPEDKIGSMIRREEYIGILNPQVETGDLCQSIATNIKATMDSSMNNSNKTLTESSTHSFFDSPQLQIQTSEPKETAPKVASFTIKEDIFSAETKVERLDGTTVKKNSLNTKDKTEHNIFKTDNFQAKFDETINEVPKTSENPYDFALSYINNPVETKPTDLFGNFKFDSNDKNIIQKPLIRETNLLESLSKDDIPILSVSSVPLFGLSTIIADKSLEMTDLEKHMKNTSLFEAPRDGKYYDRNTSVSFFENTSQGGTKQSEDQEMENVSEFNICETCREVNKPEDKETDDLTSQLIENITSPIQLSNPVEVPLTESATLENTDCDFENNQCAEISHITEETIEMIHKQVAAELLDDVNDEKTSNVRDYGWCADDETYSSDVILEHDYTFKLHSNAIGFFGNNALFFDDMPNNASDEIKAEIKNSHEDTLPRQISTPSAPPAEDDSKSDETGIDVHSIEQDAKKDFPFYEEFVIEPSETDDDKIEYKERERSSEDTVPDIDTFTNRVEKFKKMEEIHVDNEETNDKPKIFGLPPKSSPGISIASYFDTGNYAVETHYRNSISSPSSAFQVGTPNIPMRIPPGFEDEYHRRMSGVSSLDKKDLESDQDENVSLIPETSTQTPTTITSTFTNIQNIEPDLGFEVETIITELIEEPTTSPTEKLPDFASVFGVKKPEEQIEEATSILTKEEMDIKKGVIKQPEAAQLPDPINFFALNEPPKDSEEPESFNRLASYFASPAKDDHSKSFFELSQSENHYRHKASHSDKSFCQVSEGQNNCIDKKISNENYLANLKLMEDLTSVDNIEIFAKDQIVRTVNYFTVEYDNDRKDAKSECSDIFNVKTNTPKLKENLNAQATSKEVEETDKNYDTLINECKYCCNLNESKSFVSKSDNYKVRAAVNETTEPKRDSDVSMDNNNDPRRSVTVDFEDFAVHEDSNDGIALSNESRSSTEYSPVRHHWFYRVDIDDKSIWRGFSVVDSKALEDAYISPKLNENTVVATDGGRYDVNIVGRLRVAVYWNDKPTNVRRCSWFYKGTTDARYVPYTEAVADKLEEEYRHGVTTGEWHRRLVLPNSELVVMHGPGVMVHFHHIGSTDGFSAPPLFTFGKSVYRNPPKIRVSMDQSSKIDHLILLVHGAGEYRHQREKIQSTSRPRVVRRGHDESEIEDTEPSSIDHLLLLCHGVGSACDMRFRAVEEVVDDFRATSLQLVQSHYRNSYENGVVNRVEVLPISWHSTLHSGETGVDRRLAQITLDSIPRLRSFTNDTVLDVLFYTSPVYCQTIIDTVCRELNRIYNLFVKRNPGFTGGVSLGGHSLGSVILYDLLCHQNPEFIDNKIPSDKKFVSGSAGTGQPSVKYPTLEFPPAALYALGSPIAIFECIRGVESLGKEFSLPTCTNFFNIFHPYDPIAYRIEPLVNSQLRDVKPFLIPHHKGRKRMHLELKDTMVRVGADIKQKLLESLKTTWNKWKTQPPTDAQLEKVVEEEMEKERLSDEVKDDLAHNETATPDMLGRLNGGRRVDYVLQEAPLEMINEYLFAMSSHVGYWESEDTMLLMLREIYDAMGVHPDSTVPQQNLTVERTRSPKQNETIVVGASDHPSTSRGST